jgi:hypothetical protein
MYDHDRPETRAASDFSLLRKASDEEEARESRLPKKMLLRSLNDTRREKV